MNDILIKNGRVYDPETGFDEIADVLVSDGKISDVGDIGSIEGRDIQILDAAGLDVVPGFIDIHVHEDPMSGDSIDFSMERAMLRQGVTTVLGGNCGFSPDDPEKYIRYIDENGSPVNTMLLQGYNMIRGRFTSEGEENKSYYKQGDVYAHITKEQIAEACRELRKSMELGLVGVSYGLEYTPGCEYEEILEVSKTLKEYDNSLIAIHFRKDVDGCFESIQECIDLSRDSGVPLEFSHIGSCSGYADTDYMDRSLDMLRKAREEGVDIIADCYPYDAFSSLVGSAVFDGDCFSKWKVGYDAILPVQGRYKNQRCTEETFRYIRENEPDTRVVAFVMKEENIMQAYKDETMIVASDGKFIRDQGHARTAGTFPRVLGRYVREFGVLSFNEAVRKMTLLPAVRLHLKNKGRIQPGMDADITILDRNTVADGNTYTDPAKPPEGIKYVMIGGRIVLEGNDIICGSAGKFIKRQ